MITPDDPELFIITPKTRVFPDTGTLVDVTGVPSRWYKLDSLNVQGNLPKAFTVSYKFANAPKLAVFLQSFDTGFVFFLHVLCSDQGQLVTRVERW